MSTATTTQRREISSAAKHKDDFFYVRCTVYACVFSSLSLSLSIRFVWSFGCCCFFVFSPYSSLWSGCRFACFTVARVISSLQFRKEPADGTTKTERSSANIKYILLGTAIFADNDDRDLYSVANATSSISWPQWVCVCVCVGLRAYDVFLCIVSVSPIN